MDKKQNGVSLKRETLVLLALACPHTKTRCTVFLGKYFHFLLSHTDTLVTTASL